MAWSLLHSPFMQSILSLVPSTLRKSLEGPPASPEDPPVSPSARLPAEPWKEEADRWKQLADKTAAERDQLRHETTQLHSELQRLSQDLDQAKHEAEESLNAQGEELQKQNDALKKMDKEVLNREEHIQRMGEEVSQREEHIKKMTLDVQQLEVEVKKMAEEVKKSDEEKRVLGEEVTRHDEESKKKDEELEKLKEELRKALNNAFEEKQQKNSVQTLLDTRQLEMDELKLVAGADTVAEDDVLKLLQKLNSDIVQTARATREIFRLDKSTRANGKAAMEAAGAIEGWVGSALPVLLSTQYRGNAVLLQAALQAMAVAFSSWISSSYSFMHEHDQILDETYKYVMNSENQAVLGRWRALTHKYAKQGMPNLVDELTKMFITDVRNLLLVAGSSTFQIDTLISRRRDGFRSIVESAINLRKAIGEDIVSCDFETVLIHPGDVFDGSGMETAYESGSKDSGSGAGKVICTSAMGLRRCKKTKMNGKGENQWDVAVLQKPQVVLESAILSGSS
ncbi:hypothetical protein BDY19DRAFT_992273 [Irpex rosettiformis]|uniref:Uncharacterized protein n=1 Tax=Irpex rosettiformis TaxID=378272 RepID=A0ACB8U908_9APHY|nr:hypothetical protein BDY19DRAFT_992273 [Irpex rosettiformis]